MIVIFLMLGIMIGLLVSTVITFTIDQGRQYGSAFSLVHHYPEAVRLLHS